jgi:hypothetical protein
VGKSALARELGRRYPALRCLHFDEIQADLGAWAPERERRLLERREAALINAEMQSWADWLARDARERHLPILDTSEQTLQVSCDRLALLLQLGRRDGRA